MGKGEKFIIKMNDKYYAIIRYKEETILYPLVGNKTNTRGAYCLRNNNMDIQKEVLYDWKHFKSINLEKIMKGE